MAHQWARGGIKAVRLAAIAMAALAGPAWSATSDLPDNRAYELVSPPGKNGADVVPQSNKTHAASDGNGAAFIALGGFGPVAGASADFQYVSRRDGTSGTNGWSTRAVNPATSSPSQTALVSGNLPTFEAAFTPDLSGGIFRSWRPLTDAPNVADVSNLYRLRGLGSSAPEATLLSASAAPLATGSVDSGLRLLLLSTFNGGSTDLTHVIFQSPWSLTGDGGFSSFIGNLYEYADGAGTRLVARIPVGAVSECDDATGPPCEDAQISTAGIPSWTFVPRYSTGMISKDGSKIAFQVIAGDHAGAIYVRENGTRTYQLNVLADGSPGSQSAQLWALSADGNRAFFTSGEALTDAAQSGLYMYDRSAPPDKRLELVSANRTGDACSPDSVIGTSADGHYVYFVCSGPQLVAGAPADPVAGLYMWHDGQLAYVGRFAHPGDGIVDNTPQASFQSPSTTKPSRVTPDGRFLLFMTRSDEGFRGLGGFAGFDHGNTCAAFNNGFPIACRELYLYSADTGRLVCASCGTRIGVANADAMPDAWGGVSASGTTQHLSQALADDGRHVFFTSADPLVAGDVNGKLDAYEYDVASGTVHLISSGKDPSNSYFLDASPDGHDVFFVTRERLVGWDVDDNNDLYDARVGGGFPEPAPVLPQCAGDTCRSQAAAPPVAAGGASAGFHGAGDKRAHLRRHKRCKRGTVLRKVRGKRKCVHRRARRHARTRVSGERSGK